MLDTARPLAALLPRPLARRLDALRRDVAMVVGGFTGQRPSPFVERRARGATSSATATAIVARELRVLDVVRETDDAVSLRLEDPTGRPIAFEAGQFFTVIATVDGTELKRAYSASSAPHEGPGVTLTIKRVADGRVSNHLNDRVRTGDVLRVLGPSGSFVAGSASGPRTLVLLAGGSGITPIMSIARTVLARETASRLVLVYGNRRERDVIFRDALDRLARESGGRLVVRHVLSDPPPGFDGRVGLLDRANLAAELDAVGPIDDAAEFFVCGPEPMMIEARAALVERGIAPARIHEERFTQPHLRASTARAPSQPQPLRVLSASGETSAIVPAGRTLLEAGLASGAPMPFSCTLGGCAACKVRLVSGEVEMEEPNCLSDAERAERFVLACVARPLGPVVVEVPR